ncbi:MAG: Crp/Fnr family transcriptional regulator [Chitinophagales bacterium]
MKEIESYIETYFGIGGKDLSPMADLFEETTLKKNEYLLQIGKYSTGLSFLKEGFVRLYAYNQSGEKEITQWISSKGMFVTDLSSLIFNTPSRWNAQALSDCHLYTMSKDKYQKINQLLGNWAELEKLFIAKCFVTLENRVFNQLSMTAEEKYRHLFQLNPEIFNQVPLQYIASMLGMTPETLSRTRRKLIP